MNPNELKLNELQEAEAQIKAEIAQAKADIQIEKAETVKATPVNIDGGRGLQGNRDAEGSLIPAGKHEMPDGELMDDDEMADEPTTMSMEEAIESLVMKSLGDYDSYKDKGVIGDAAEAAGMSRVDFVMSPEFQAAYGNKYDKDAQPLEVTVMGDDSNLEGQALEDALDQKMQDDVYNMDINARKDSESAKMREGSTGKQDRATPMKDETTPRSMGMTQDEGGTCSVDENSRRV